MNCDFDYLLLENQIKCGFPVPSYIKRVMMVQLKMLKIVEEICKRHNISYYAESGTLLGAIRHEGFIPWDDDLDIVMLRSDYEKFYNAALQELPEDYRVLSIFNEESYNNYLIRIVNGSGINSSKEFLDENYGCPYVVGIDVFVYDYMAPTRELFEDQKNDCFRINAYIKGFYKIEEAGNLLKELSAKYKVKLPENKSIKNRLYLMQDHIMSYYNNDERCSDIGLTPFWLESQNHICPKKYYDMSVMCRFENTEIPVPLFYEDILKGRYGEFMTLNKASGLHDYPYFQDQVDILRNALGKSKFEFVYDDSVKDNLIKYKSRKEGASLRREKIYKDYIDNMEKAYETIYQLFMAGNTETALTVIEKCQEIGIALGNLIERIYGLDDESEGHAKKAVLSLEKYCEKAYELYLGVAHSEDISDCFNAFADAINNVSESIENNIINKNTVVFLSVTGSLQKDFEWINSEINDSEVLFVNVPYLLRDMSGNITDSKVYGDLKLDIYGINPDVIYCNSSLDNYSSVLLAHPKYSYDKLIESTDKFIYVETGLTTDITKDDFRAYKNLKHFLIKPGILYADSIVFLQESLKESFISLISEWVTEDGRDDIKQNVMDIIAEKTCVLSRKNNSESHKKQLLYYIGASSMCKNPDKYIDKIKRNFKLFYDNRDKLNVKVVISDMLKYALDKYYPDYAEKLNAVMDIEKQNGIIVSKEDGDNLCADAYYGDAGKMAAEMIIRKKPVMLQNIEY